MDNSTTGTGEPGEGGTHWGRNNRNEWSFMLDSRDRFHYKYSTSAGTVAGGTAENVEEVLVEKGIPTTAEKAYDQLASIYDGNFTTKRDLAENEALFRLLTEEGLHEGRVLDVGCGTGLYLEMVSKAPGHYVGTDISDGMLRVAHDKFPFHHFRKADMGERVHEGRERESFNSTVCLFGSYSYTNRPLQAMEGMASATARFGKVMVQALGPKYHKRGSHIVEQEGYKVPFWTYRCADLRNYMLTYGLRYVKVYGFNAFGDMLKWLPAPLLRSYLYWEAKTVGRWFPGLCYYQIAIGEKV